MAMTFFRWFFAIADPRAVRVARTSCATGRALSRTGRSSSSSARSASAPTTALAYLGLNYTTATNGVILNSFIPVMIVAISWLFLRERLTPLQIAGIAVSLAGVFTILSDGSLATLLAFRAERRRPLHHPVDGDVVGLHDRAALAARRACTSCRSCSWSR